MKVVFDITTVDSNGIKHRMEDWELSSVPRVGEQIELKEGVMSVEKVIWVLVDDETRKPLKSPYAQVRVYS